MYDYDIALSFSGDERPIASKVANILSENGIRVFYDEYFDDYLWGKFLPDTLQDVYKNRAKYCVIFISESYKENVMTNVERRAAVERAIREPNEYILPVRVDETVLPSISEDTVYFDLRHNSVEKLCNLILKKLGEIPPRLNTASWEQAVKLLRITMREWGWDKKSRKFSHEHAMIDRDDVDTIA